MNDQNRGRDPGRPGREEYRHFMSLPTRWMDNDIYGHVNNVTYYSYFDTAANTYLIEKGGLAIHSDEVVGFVVASACQYRRPIAFPQLLEIGLRVNSLGNRSVEYGIGIFTESEDAVSAFGNFTHAFVNRTTGQSVAIPTTIRMALEAII